MSAFMMLVDAVAATGSPVAKVMAAAHPTTAPVSTSPLLGLVSALAWPIVALAIGMAFRKPFSAFMAAVGGRITKLSVFKIELELVPAVTATATPLLESIKAATSGAEIADSSQMMLDQIELRTPADFATIQLGGGDEWLTSRLFIAAMMLERMRSVRALVFVEPGTNTGQRFVAIAAPGQLRWVLAQHYPWLEAAWLRAALEAAWPRAALGAAWPRAAGEEFSGDLDPEQLPNKSMVTSDSGAIDPWSARQLVSNFIQSLQKDTPNGPKVAADWVSFERGVSERASWVTRALLEALLPPAAFDAWTNELRDAPREKLTRAVLRRPTDFVALVDDERKFVRLVNRKALLEEMATSFGAERDA